jgi:membrane fusion protein, multidrug efflux system
MKNQSEVTMKTKNMVSIGMCCLIAMAGMSGCKLPQKKKAELSAERIRVNVAVAPAVRQTMYQKRKVLGFLAAYRETDLGPLSPGRVKSLPVKIGDYVKQGRIVARMDDVQLSATDAQFAQVKAQYDRTKNLYESNAAPKAQFEAAEAQYKAMKRQMENLDENTVIKAPFSGVVTGKACEAGELYTPMGRGLVHIIQLNPLKIDLDLDEQTVQYVKKGMPVRLLVEQASDSGELTGAIEWVNPQASPMGRTFSARVIVQNDKNLLRPGYFVEVHILIGEKKNALIVPRQALVDDRMFVMKDSIAVSVKVALGWVTDEFAEVLSGIQENDKVIVAGNKALPDSAKVNVVQTAK